MTNIRVEPFVTLIVHILFVCSLVYSLEYEIVMIKRITIFQTDCSSSVYRDNYPVHSTNKTSFKIRKPYDFMGGTVQNGLIYLYELNSTDRPNNCLLDGKLRSSPSDIRTKHSLHIFYIHQS